MNEAMTKLTAAERELADAMSSRAALAEDYVSGRIDRRAAIEKDVNLGYTIWLCAEAVRGLRLSLATGL